MFAVRPAMARLLIGVLALAAAAVAVVVLFAAHASAGAVDVVTVNTTANINDGACEGPPNDNTGGNCSFQEAIDQVNAGLADTIKFHPAVFSKASPGVIQLDTGEGELPPIVREVVIDNTNTAVVLDCDADNNATWGCDYGIAVLPSHNGFDFSLLGGKQFAIQEIAGDAIIIDGDEVPPCSNVGDASCSLGDVIITGVNIHLEHPLTDAGGSGIVIVDTVNLNNIQIVNNIIEADDEDSDDVGIRITTYDSTYFLANNNVLIKNNRVSGGQAIAMDIWGSLYSGIGGLNPAGHKLLVDILENETLIGDAGHAINIGYCEGVGDDCDATDSQINVNILDNGKIASNDDDTGSGDAIRVDIESLDDPERAQANVIVHSNAIIDSDDDDGVRIDIDFCCGTSDSSATVQVTGNDDIVGDDEGVEITADVEAGPHNTLDVQVDDNGEITGEGGHGVEVDGHAGSSSGDTDSDENTAVISVRGNDNINGDNDDGVHIDAVTGKDDGAGDADRNKTEVYVEANDDINGEDDGVSIDARAGTADGSGDADDNQVIVKVNDNGAIDGSDDEGIDIDATSGHIADDNPDDATGDGNSTDVQVDDNDTIKGHDGHGIQVDSWSGGIDTHGEDNSTLVNITNNRDITGQQAGHDGVHIESTVCCDPLNTNTVNIHNNENIIGQDADGIDIDELCCSFNTVTITDNSGVIKGNDDVGVEISPCLASGNPHDPDSVTPDDLACMADTVTLLIITGNNISNSGNDGILVCCGAYQYPTVQAPPVIAGVPVKSLIADNTISHNGEDGIDLDTTIGLNVEHNDVFANGTSVLDGDNGIEVDWQFAYFIWDTFGFKIPAHYNRISENSTYDNVGLGINLIGDQPELFGRSVSIPGSGDENGIPADGVGCLQFTETPITANDCVPYPKLIFVGPGDKLSGSACSLCYVEVFLADPTPEDQTGPLGRQHGEGRTYVITTQADELGSFSVELPCDMDPGILTATATDKLKNTSEFASNVQFPGTSVCATATPTATDTPVPTDTPTQAPPTDTPQPTATNTPTTPPTPAKLCGDVNDDGLVNAVDAELILQLKAHLVDQLANEPSGDVNSDGQLTSVDAALILQKAAGLITQNDLHCP